MRIPVLLSLCMLLVACSGASDKEKSTFDPGPDCQGACASGYRWALDKEVTSKALCRGEGEFTRGCERAVDFANPFGR